MKVPVYQNQISYEKAHASNVLLARPLREASGSKGWMDVTSAAGVLGGLYALPGAVNRTVNAFGAAQKEWEKEWADLQEKIAGKNKPRQKTAPSQAAGPSAAGADDGTAENVGKFSSPLRSRLLQFAREKAFETALEPTEQSRASGAQTALQRLDENFAWLSGGLSDASTPQKDNLLTQDYTLLRREVQELEEKSRRTQEQENIRQGAYSFVQTAALVPTPRALESYMQSNLSAAAQEARSAGVGEKQWQQQSRALRWQAVRHNVEAALEAGQTERAQSVYRHFAKELPSQQQELLAHKLTARQADMLGEKLWPAARAACTGEQGETEEKALAEFARRAAPRQTPAFQQQLADALNARLAQSRSLELRRRRAGYERLLAAPQGADLTALMKDDAFSTADFETNCRALRQWQQTANKQSSAAVFNRLHQGLLNGKLNEKELEKSLQSGELSAPDFWRLKARSCAAQAGDYDARVRLLEQGLALFCRRQELTPQQSDELRYFVFTSSEDVAQQIQAAQTAKQLFLLQENKK